MSVILKTRTYFGRAIGEFVIILSFSKSSFSTIQTEVDI